MENTSTRLYNAIIGSGDSVIEVAERLNMNCKQLARATGTPYKWDDNPSLIRKKTKETLEPFFKIERERVKGLTPIPIIPFIENSIIHYWNAHRIAEMFGVKHRVVLKFLKEHKELKVYYQKQWLLHYQKIYTAKLFIEAVRARGNDEIGVARHLGARLETVKFLLDNDLELKDPNTGESLKIPYKNYFETIPQQIYTHTYPLEDWEKIVKGTRQKKHIIRKVFLLSDEGIERNINVTPNHKKVWDKEHKNANKKH